MAKLLEKHRKMSFGAELFLLLLLFFIFLSLQLVSADWCVLQQGKLIVRFVVLLLTDTRIPCSTTHFLLSERDGKTWMCFTGCCAPQQTGSEGAFPNQAVFSEKGHFFLTQLLKLVFPLIVLLCRVLYGQKRTSALVRLKQRMMSEGV